MQYIQLKYNYSFESINPFINHSIEQQAQTIKIDLQIYLETTCYQAMSNSYSFGYAKYDVDTANSTLDKFFCENYTRKDRYHGWVRCKDNELDNINLL